ncbi:MAG: hypothetical protein DWQ02_25575, partial [Bacteroidetes bacterium]
MIHSHQIQTLYLDLTLDQPVNKEVNGQKIAQLQDNLSNKLMKKALPFMENILNNYCGNSEDTVFIDRLELDLSIESSSNWENQFPAMVVDALEKALAKMPFQHQEVFDRKISMQTAFFFFFKKGRFPWNSEMKTVPELEAQILKSNPDLPKLKPLIKKAPIRKRLVTQFSDDFFLWVTQKVLGLPTELIQKIKHKIIPELQQRNTVRLIENFKYWVILKSLEPKWRKLPATELLKQVTNVLKPGNKLHKLDLSTMDLKLTKLTDLEDS